jgi:hypothetical protein
MAVSYTGSKPIRNYPEIIWIFMRTPQHLEAETIEGTNQSMDVYESSAEITLGSKLRKQ